MTDFVIAQKVLIPAKVAEGKNNFFCCSFGKIATQLFGDSWVYRYRNDANQIYCFSKQKGFFWSCGRKYWQNRCFPAALITSCSRFIVVMRSE